MSPRPGLSPALWVWSCILLHAILVLAHLVLLVLGSSETVHNVIVPLARTNELSSYISLGSQLIIIPYTAVLLFITQSLALRYLLSRKHTLTAAHDIWSAWSGFGAACISLYRQTAVAASVLGVFRVTVYLGCIAILHIMTPALLSIQTFVQDGAMVVPTTVGMPTIHNASLFPAFPIANATLNPWTTAGEMLTSIPMLGYNTTVGLLNSTVYDIASPNTGVGSIPVGMQTANVSCGYVPGVSVSVVDMYEVQIKAVYGIYNFSWTLYTSLSGGVMVSSTRYDAATNTSILLGRHAFIVTSLNLTDDSGNIGPTQLDGIANSSINTNLNLLGCTLSWEKQYGLVDQQTRLLLELPPSPVQPREWTVWTPQIQEGGFGGYVNVDNQVDSWADMLDSAPNAPDTSPTNILATDRFVGLALGDVNEVTSLVQFERALGDMTAAAYWSVGRVAGSATQGSFMSLDSSTSSVGQDMSRLNINIAQVAVGLCTSMILFLLATEIALRSRKAPVDSVLRDLGVLQFLWLMVHDPVLRDRIAAVAEPTTYQLRQAGIVELDPAAVDRMLPLRKRQSGTVYDLTHLIPLTRALSTSESIGDSLHDKDSKYYK